MGHWCKRLRCIYLLINDCLTIFPNRLERPEMCVNFFLCTDGGLLLLMVKCMS